MNYEKEINAFYDCIERNPLSASAGVLWFALMHINSKTMWAATFTVSAPVLRLKSGLTVSSFKRARTELKEKATSIISHGIKIGRQCIGCSVWCWRGTNKRNGMRNTT